MRQTAKHLAATYKKGEVVFIPIIYQEGSVFGETFLIPESISHGLKYSNPYVAAFIAKAEAFLKSFLLGGCFKADLDVQHK